MTLQLHHGDCRSVLWTEAITVDAVVTDPPYELNFMGRAWDRSGVVLDPATWRTIGACMKPGAHLLAMGGTRTFHRLTCAIEDAGFEIRDCLMWIYGSGFPKSRAALKPAYEPIILARKRGKRWLNIDACRVDTDECWVASGELTGGSVVNDYGDGLNNAGRSGSHAAGRWPANVLHDGSDEVLQVFPASNGGGDIHRRSAPKTKGVYGAFAGDGDRWSGYGDTGSAARFFYCAKASTAERNGSTHPTIKPLALMRWLVRLITPPNGTVLDPFCGTGTTLQAAEMEGFDAIGIDSDAATIADAHKRVWL